MIFFFWDKTHLDFLKAEYIIFLFSVLVSEGIYTGTDK